MTKINKEFLLELYQQGYTDKKLSEYFNSDIQHTHKIRRSLGLVGNKKSNLIKELNYEEKQVLLGTVIGDTTLIKNTLTESTHGSMMHGVKQKEYIEWKYSKLKRFINSVKFSSNFHKIRKVMEYRYRCDITSNKCLDYFYYLFYDKDKKKNLNVEVINLLEPLGLAVWFMDDGSKTNSGGYYLHTNCFSKENQEQIIKVLEEKFKLKINLHKTSKGAYIMYISARSAKQFERLVSPFIIESMKYKLHNKIYKYNMIEIENNNHFTTYRGLNNK